jgi:hypothetical protein
MQLADTFLDEAIFKHKIAEAKIVLGDSVLNSGLRNTLLKEAHKEARVAIRAHDGNVTDAISTARFTEKVQEWHKLNDFADGVGNVPGESNMRRMANEANDYAKSLETRIMGASSASGFIVHKQTREENKASNKERETQTPRKTDEQKESQVLPKIKEKEKKYSAAKNLRENKF